MYMSTLFPRGPQQGHTFCVIFKKPFSNPRSQRSSPIFFVEILNSRFYFYSIIHFKLIFFVMVWSMNWGSIFFVYGLHMAQFFFVIISVQYHLLKSFSTELPLQFGQKSVDHIFIGLFLDFLLFSINLYIFHQNHTWLL